MTPMIDMVFLLLIFFMCAATMSQVDLTPDIQLPIAPKAAVPEDLRNRGTINILPVGTITTAGETVTKRRPFMVYGQMMDESELKKSITARLVENPDLRVNMRIDRNANFALVRRAIRACAEAGVFDIIFASYQSNSGG